MIYRTKLIGVSSQLFQFRIKHDNMWARFIKRLQCIWNRRNCEEESRKDNRFAQISSATYSSDSLLCCIVIFFKTALNKQACFKADPEENEQNRTNAQLI